MNGSSLGPISRTVFTALGRSARGDTVLAARSGFRRVLYFGLAAYHTFDLGGDAVVFFQELLRVLTALSQSGIFEEVVRAALLHMPHFHT